MAPQTSKLQEPATTTTTTTTTNTNTKTKTTTNNINSHLILKSMRHRSVPKNHPSTNARTIAMTNTNTSTSTTRTDDADFAAGIIHVELPTSRNHDGSCSPIRSSNITANANANAAVTPRSKTSSEHALEEKHKLLMQLHDTTTTTTTTHDYSNTSLPNLPNVDATSTNANTNTNTNAEQIQVLGINITHLSRKYQFIVCATGVCTFSLLYGYLQELISVTLCNRQLGLFLAMMQFLGYTIWSKIFYLFVNNKNKNKNNNNNNNNNRKDKRKDDGYTTTTVLPSNSLSKSVSSTTTSSMGLQSSKVPKTVPIKLYIFLSILRAIDASMTNMAMAYVNYPAKTLMKSSRVVFTMIFSTLIRRKKYKLYDYIVVLFMVSGLVIFMHADSKSSAIFQPMGIMMLLVSLSCDGVITNMSEAVMTQYKVGQDEFIYNLYSIAVCGIIGAACIKGDFYNGISYILTPGTLEEIETNVDVSLRTWNVSSKIIVFILFSSTGFFGSSCSALITKEFGALTMSITSTARKAMTLFLSFALFNNVCTLEHISGIFLFVTALIAKSFRASRGSGGNGGSDKMSHSHKGHDHREDDKRMVMEGEHSLSLASSSQYNDMAETETPKKKESSVKRRYRRRHGNITADIV